MCPGKRRFTFMFRCPLLSRSNPGSWDDWQWGTKGHPWVRPGSTSGEPTALGGWDYSSEQGPVGAQQILTLASRGCKHRPKGRAALARLLSASLLQKGAGKGEPRPLGPSQGMSGGGQRSSAAAWALPIQPPRNVLAQERSGIGLAKGPQPLVPQVDC